MKNPSLLQRVVDRFASSRDLTISFLIHTVLVAMLSTAVLVEVTQEVPSDFQAGDGMLLADRGPRLEMPQASTPSTQPEFSPADIPSPSSPSRDQSPNILRSESGPFEMPILAFPAPGHGAPMLDRNPIGPSGLDPNLGRVSERPSPENLRQLKEFTNWTTGSPNDTGKSLTQRGFKFVAFIGQYQGGDWDATVQLDRNREIVSGSLPNLLWLTTRWSKGKIETNEREVKAIRLDSDALFVEKPPFIYLTGTRDFVLTDREVENLRKYIMMGGCIWGDSALPGQRSRFDIAFQREMRRVIPDVDKQFEPLPASHPLFTKAYFPEIKSLPPGLNYYQDPVQVLRIFGEIAIIYTSNDYGDMWQIGLQEDGQVDLRRNEAGRYVAINPKIWDYRGTYLGNVTPQPGTSGRGSAPAANLADTYKFGVNVIVHLLTRWDQLKASSPL